MKTIPDYGDDDVNDDDDDNNNNKLTFLNYVFPIVRSVVSSCSS